MKSLLIGVPALELSVGRLASFLFKSSFLGFAGRRCLSKSSTGHEVWRRPTVQVGNNSFCTFIGICDAKYSFFFSLIQPKAHFYARWPGFSWPRCPDCKRQKVFICQVCGNTLEFLAKTRNMNFANRQRGGLFHMEPGRLSNWWRIPFCRLSYFLVMP